MNYPTTSFKAPQGGEVKFTMICHGSIAISYEGYEIQVDPVASNNGKNIDYSTFPKADLILVTHGHYDHLDVEAVKTLSKGGTMVICNPDSVSSLSGCEAMENGDITNLEKVTVKAVPAYNITEGHTKFHPKGTGNGYLVSIGGLNVYVAGDTEDIPELAQLKDIDVAFLPVNQPYTMTVAQCIHAVEMFKPKVLVPYHTGDTDLSGLKVEGVEIRTFESLR